MSDQSAPLLLADLQQAMKNYITTGTLTTALEESVMSSGLSPQARLQIHSNNFRLSLRDSLRTTFPLVEAFVGERFFAAMASDFIGTSVPEAPLLSAWGGEFPSFLQNSDRMKEIPYVADVAALEWAIHESSIAPDEGVASPEMPVHDIRITASARLARSRWPLMMLWMVGRGQMQAEALDLGSGGQNILVYRQGGAVKLHILDDASSDLFEKLVADLASCWPAGTPDHWPLDGFQKDLFVRRT